MEELSKCDYEAVLSFVGGIHVVATFDGFADLLLAQLQKLIRADAIDILEDRTDAGASFYRFHPARIDANQIHQKVWQRVGHEHPALGHYLHTRDSRFTRIPDLLTQTPFDQLLPYSEFYSGTDVENTLAIFFRPFSGALAAIVLYRDRQSFSERDRLLLNLARPHIVQAWRRAEADSIQRERILMMTRVPVLLNFGTVSCDGEGNIGELSEWTGNALIEFFGGIAISSRRLPQPIAQWLRESKMRPSSEGSLRPLQPLILERNDARLIVTLLPGASEDHLLIQRRRMGPDRARMAELGLTARESEVLLWVAKGKTNGEIATILGISARTIQKHLENIFAKLGVESRTAAASAMQEAVPA